MQDVDRTNGWAYSLKLISVFDSSQGIYQGGPIELNNQPFTGVIRPTTPFNGNCNSGMQTFEINLKDKCSGIYFCKVQTEGKTKLYKIIK